MNEHPSSLGLVLGRVMIAAAWADGELSATERTALGDLLFSLPDLDGESWRALSADIDRPFPAEHLEVLLEQLRARIRDEQDRQLARAAIEDLSSRLGANTPEASALREALDRITTPQVGTPSTNESWWKRLSASVRQHAERIAQVNDRERAVQRALDAKIAAALPDLHDLAPDELRRLSLAASILAHVVRLDGVVDDGERVALRLALEEHYGLAPEMASVVTELALDEVATGIDLHALMRDFTNVTSEDQRQRFLAAVFRVAAGDGRASYDEIEEVRRIGRGLLLSHRHFISAKLSLPGKLRET